MNVDLIASLVTYGSTGAQVRRLRKRLHGMFQVPLVGDLVVITPEAEAVRVESVTWSESLDGAALILESLDADELGTSEMAMEALRRLGWLDAEVVSDADALLFDVV
jgi:hypothetical protein